MAGGGLSARRIAGHRAVRAGAAEAASHPAQRSGLRRWTCLAGAEG
eukprot:gene59714-81708_t